jgi:hypothetical protein
MVVAEELLGLEWPDSLFKEGDDLNLRQFVARHVRFGSTVRFPA